MKLELPGKINLTGNDVIDTAYTISALYEPSYMERIHNLVNSIDYDVLSDDYDNDLYSYFANELGIELEECELESIEELI